MDGSDRLGVCRRAEKVDVSLWCGAVSTVEGETFQRPYRVPRITVDAGEDANAGRRSIVSVENLLERSAKNGESAAVPSRHAHSNYLLNSSTVKRRPLSSTRGSE